MIEREHPRTGPPRLAAYCPTFRQTEDLVAFTVNKLTRAHENISQELAFSDEAIKYVCNEELVRVRRPQNLYPVYGSVACLGPAGAGKSSTVNSLLGKDTVAIEHDGGDRGTYVVHEYHGSHRNQETAFHVVITFRSPSAVDKLVKQHYDIIRRYLASQDENSADEDLSRGTEADDEEERKARYLESLDFFSELLQMSCDEFGSQNSTERFFIKAREEEEEEDDDDDDDDDDDGDSGGGGGGDDDGRRHHDVLGDLCDKIKKVDGYQESALELTVTDQAALGDVFMQFARPTVHGIFVNALWRLIDKIAVYHDSDILNTGLVLADAPGTGDSDPTVRCNTDCCISSSSAVLVFADISRCKDNEELRRNLRKCITSGKERQTCLVVTHIDEKKHFASHEKAHITPAMVSLRETIVCCEKAIAASEKEKEDATEFAQLQSLDRRIKAQQTKLVGAEAELTQLTVKANCTLNDARLRDTWRKLSPSKQAPELKIFYVSNSEYRKHLSGKRPLLDFETTGIPSLSTHIYELAARGKAETLRHIVEIRLPNLIRGINGILNKTPMERKTEVESVVQSSLAQYLPEIISSLLQSVMRHVQQNLVSTVTDNQEDWIKSCEKLLSGWTSECKAQTFLAFCRRSGEWRVQHGTGKGPRREAKNWNTLIRHVADDDLICAFDEFDENIHQEEIAFDSRVMGISEKLKDIIDKCEASHGIDMHEFFVFIDGRLKEVARELSTQFVDFKKLIMIIRARCVVDEEDNYVKRVMQPVYEKCQLMRASDLGGAELPRSSSSQKRPRRAKGTVQSARSEAIRDHIRGTRGNSVFQAAIDLAVEDFSNYLDSIIKYLMKVTKEARERILKDFGSRFQNESLEAQDANSEVVGRYEAAMREAAKAAEDEVKGPLFEKMQQCIRYENGAD
ncbi:uncharacterized protein K489DRAFT_16058 [Dissoconium aciculare CBS 342.82]|uniref:DUF7605 domain-containing protein n=1 Tax=Dissoconium aciculare CBS 342.82 TaxID=1314786 RepID=A0A6J3MI93_9PEZI|nr:uncharacterized protein K489DRAFT_16058 [Dissoconium aciculare CBS 342.82]KAF1827424.1 hypothetical protein K489DRAFT_16058 [Dissoconium aciculare CBS 342.82]